MVEVSNASFFYNADTAIHLPSFRLGEGDHCLLLGESGSGKTTLLHLLGGLLRGYSGNIKIKDQELKDMSEGQLDAFRGKHLGFIFQRNHLLRALDVEHNLKLAPYLAGMRVEEARIEQVLTRLVLREKRKSKISQLSQGQAQRVAIARAVLHQPAIILADEPTSALDDSNCERVIDLLLHIAEENKATLIIATHDQRLKTQISKHVLLQSHNKIVTS